MRILQLFILLSAVLNVKYLFAQQIDSGTVKINNLSIPEIKDATLKIKNIDLDKNTSNLKKIASVSPLKTLPKPHIILKNGIVTYATYFRSIIDTPFLQHNISQHHLNMSVAVTLANKYPLKSNAQILKSNSPLFRDIIDVQVEFDMPAYNLGIYEKIKTEFKNSTNLLKDTLALMASRLKYEEIMKLEGSFSHLFTMQKLIEANEIINIPKLTWDQSLPDSLAKIKSDSLKAEAIYFIKLYQESTLKIEKLKSIADSLSNVFKKSLVLVKQLSDVINGNMNNTYQFMEIKRILKAKGNDYLLSKKNSWLSGLRKLSIGKTTVDYSELTVKNIHVNGLNFEYNNSRYYFSVTAGLIDFRYRDYLLHNSKKPRQSFYMGRIGVGSLENNYIILSVFKGQKQVFKSGNFNNLFVSKIIGASIEARYQMPNNSYFKVEIAESISPDFRMDPPKNNKWNLKDKTDKAFIISSYFFIPRTRTRIDAKYKYTGANYQSFSYFQTNSTLHTWNIKAEQLMFKRHLKISAALKSNEFSNPYIIQSYQTNTIFKSLQVLFRKKRWPTISGGYMPVSQLSNINGNIIENKFNSINSNLHYNYRIRKIKGASLLVYSRFYNSSADSGFIYFNARNISFNQIFYFRKYISGINITYSTNLNHRFLVMDEYFKVAINNVASLGIGIKINNLNYSQTAIGAYGNFQLNVFKKASLSFNVEDGFIPGYNGSLINNTVMNLQLSKVF